MRRSLLLLAMSALVAMVSVEARRPPAPAPPPEGDISCGNQRYLVPGLCLQKCTGRRTLGNLSAGQCFFNPQCPALQGDQRLKQFYNQGILHSGGPQVLPTEVAQRSVVAQIINVHYKPFNAGQFDIRIGNFAGMDASAGIERGSTGAWMNEDPWVKAEWIPKNPNWKTAKAGPNPDPKECSNP